MFKNLMGLPIQWCNTCWNILLKHRGVSFYKKTVATGYTNDGMSPSSHSQATEEEKWAVLSKLWMDERKVLNLKWRKGTGSLSTVFKHSICIIYVRIVMNTYDSTYTHKYQSFSCQFFNSIFCSCPSVTFYHFLNRFFLLHQLVGRMLSTNRSTCKNWGLKNSCLLWRDQNRCHYAQSVSFRFQVAVTPKKFMLPWCFILMWSHETLLSSKVESRWAWDGGPNDNNRSMWEVRDIFSVEVLNQVVFSAICLKPQTRKKEISEHGELCVWLKFKSVERPMARRSFPPPCPANHQWSRCGGAV